jgi:hypothetical protein
MVWAADLRASRFAVVKCGEKEDSLSGVTVRLWTNPVGTSLLLKLVELLLRERVPVVSDSCADHTSNCARLSIAEMYIKSSQSSLKYSRFWRGVSQYYCGRIKREADKQMGANARKQLWRRHDWSCHFLPRFTSSLLFRLSLGVALGYCRPPKYIETRL